MFERFTDRARRVVVLAQEEARHLNHNYIGTEHILLGLIHESEGIAARALTELDISLEAVRAQVAEIVGRGAEAPSGHIPFTPRAKKVLELSLREALSLGHNYIGTEHILLGLIREGEGVAAQVLVKLGASFDRVRQQVIQILADASQLQTEQVGGVPPRISQQQAMAMVAAGPGVYRDEPAELVRVVPVAREVHREAGMRVVLISLEIWSGWIDLRFAMLPGSSSGGRIQWLLDWQVEDDAGTTYEKAGMATGGGQQLHVTQLGFRPAPPEGARTLTLTLVDGDEPNAPMAVVEIELATEA
jgi:hypothetical protein